jgi:hypothetical protein
MTQNRKDGLPVINVKKPYLHKLHYRLRMRLPIWVIYKPTTSDYYGKWVARMHVALPEAKPTRFVMTHNSLEELRNLLPVGLEKMERSRLDDIVIQEVWI